MYLLVKIFNNGLIVACPPLIVFVVVAAADLLENGMVCYWCLLAEVMELDHFQTVEDVDTMLFCWTFFLSVVPCPRGCTVPAVNGDSFVGWKCKSGWSWHGCKSKTKQLVLL